MPREKGAGYKLKPGVKFHLYINTAPCGDARIFSPHEDQTGAVDKHPNRKARGQLRTKIESGEGTIPVKSSNGIQTWDGIVQVHIYCLLLSYSLIQLCTLDLCIITGRTFTDNVLFRQDRTMERTRYARLTVVTFP